MEDKKQQILITRCKRCNRKLKDEESIKLGYGKTCYKKVAGIIDKHKKLF